MGNAADRFRRLDREELGRPRRQQQDGSPPSRWRRLRHEIAWFFKALLVVVVLAFVAGIMWTQFTERLPTAPDQQQPRN